MKAKELKSKIKKILQEQFKAAPKMPEKIPASRKGATRMVRPNMTQNQTMRTKYADVKNKIAAASTDQLKITALVNHYKQNFNMSDEDIKNHFRSMGKVKNTPGCAANSIAEDLYNEQALPNMDMGKGSGGRGEERILGWILGCGVVIGLLNLFKVGQGSGGGGGGGTGPGNEGEDDCFFDPTMC